MIIIQNATRPSVIRDALVDLISQDTTELKVASAYVTRSACQLLIRELCLVIGEESANAIPKTLISCFDYGITEPSALRYWMGLPNSFVKMAGERALRRGSLQPHVAFHPKVYAFTRANTASNVLVGSANLTMRGITVNTEAASIRADVESAAVERLFNCVAEGAVELNDELLELYENLRTQIPDDAIGREELTEVEEPHEIEIDQLTSFWESVEGGQIEAEGFSKIWFEVIALQGGSRNQLELPRGAHKFFGYNFDDYGSTHVELIGQPQIMVGHNIWQDKRLTWHGDNQMERMNLPTFAQSGLRYENSAVLFRQTNKGHFELVVSPWDSDLSKSWRNASRVSGTTYRLGITNRSRRVVGLIP